MDAFPFRAEPDDPPYVAFLGRLHPGKRPHSAIEAAREAGLPLRIAGRVKPPDRAYFLHEIASHIDGEKVVYLGELGFSGKVRLLGGARATLVTSILPEPFGLVTAESLSCGTPVIATRSGAVGELLEEGTSGFITSEDTDFPELLHAVAGLDRQACRDQAASRFSSRRMSMEYENLYGRIIAENH